MEADRVSSRTLLRWGYADAPVALFKTATDNQERPEFVKAGPNGKPLERTLALGGKRFVPEAVAEEPESVSPAPDYPDPLSASRDFVEAEEEPEERPVVATFEEGGETPLDETDVRKGLMVDGKFVDLTKQLEDIEAETKLEVMEVTGFIRRETVERYRIKGSYYLGPEQLGGKVLRLLRHAITETQRAAVVKWTKRTRQALGVIVPGPRKSLIVLEMEWAENVLDPGPRCRDLDQIEATAGELDAAAGLAMAMYESRDLLNEQEDDRVRLERALAHLAERGHVAGFEVPTHPEPEEETDNLERLLELSVEAVA